MVYLAVNFGYEGWQFKEYPSPGDALEAVKNGRTFGHEWKILKELKIEIKEE